MLLTNWTGVRLGEWRLTPRAKNSKDVFTHGVSGTSEMVDREEQNRKKRLKINQGKVRLYLRV
jgi:hypothetical protein